MSNRYRHSFPSRLLCNDCGAEQTIVRPQARRRGANHQKHLWCVRCMDRTQHTELGDA